MNKPTNTFLFMKKLLSLFLLLSCLLGTVSAEDGSRLWLRQSTDAHAQITAPRQSPTLNIAVRELKQAWKGLPVTLVLKKDKQLSSEGFRIRQVNGKLTVTSPSETGLLLCCLSLDPPARNAELRKAFGNRPGNNGESCL